ncbi:MAG: hypothetical protein HKN19_03445 [Halioglobus sp.]|nr:hypothetical protein [Halioglobus sp.]
MNFRNTFAQRTRIGHGLLCSALLCLLGCADSGDTLPPSEAPTRLNHLQYLGTHNSYHIELRADLLDLLRAFDPDLAASLEYSHLPLDEQFSRQGIRQIELDIFHDPEGGLYATRRALALIEEDTASGIPELDRPGLKVLHVQEVDYETTCFTFVACLTVVKAWSDDNPGHLPIMILVEAKDDPIPDPVNLDFTVPLPVDHVMLDTIDTEIRSVFPDERIILPDGVRGASVTLEQAILENGWPTLDEARGKVLFALDNGGDVMQMYIDGHPSLEGRVLFTSAPAGTAEAAFMKLNNPLGEPGRIEEFVRQGYLVRTRADSDTTQSRENDPTQRDAALASGAHYISTDYPEPNLEFSDYRVQFPEGTIARCNPVNPGTCTTADLAP